jgi:hypothetical protein
VPDDRWPGPVHAEHAWCGKGEDEQGCILRYWWPQSVSDFNGGHTVSDCVGLRVFWLGKEGSSASFSPLPAGLESVLARLGRTSPPALGLKEAEPDRT